MNRSLRASQADNEGSIPFTRSTIFKGSRRASLSVSALLQVREPAATLPHSHFHFMLTHGKPVFLVSFSGTALKS